jgi:hypothetical protein
VTVLALKLLLAPLLVVASSLAGRRWGPRVAGILIVLPVVAGPILLILYLDHGSRFAAGAASAATLGIVPLALFTVLFGYLSRRHSWFLTLLASWLTVLAADLALAQVEVPVGAALVLALLALYGASTLLRRLHPPPCDWYRSIGRPRPYGCIDAFPIALSVVCAFATAQTGHVGVLTLLRGIVPSLDGFALFCFLVAITIDRMPAVAAFGIATTAAVGFAVFLVAKTPNHIAPSFWCPG